MPTYDYMCNKCSYKFEVFHGMNDTNLICCPECNTDSLIKLISPGAGVIIRGTDNPCNGGRHRKKKDRLGEGKNKPDKPFWRDGKVNKKILNDPQKYMRSGEVD